MNRKIRISLSAFIAFSIIGLVVMVLIHYQTKENLGVKFKGDEKVQVRIDKIQYSGTKNGKVEWELVADSASRVKGEDLTVFENIKVTFYSRDGAPYVLTAKQGRFMEEAGEIFASGDVIVESPAENYRLKTETLKYGINTKEISSEDRVGITSDRLDVEGTGLLGSVDKKSFTLSEKVRAVFRDPAPQVRK